MKKKLWICSKILISTKRNELFCHKRENRGELWGKIEIQDSKSWVVVKQLTVFWKVGGECFCPLWKYTNEHWNATKSKPFPSLSAFLLCHTPAHIPHVCVSPCMQLLRHVLYSSCTIPYSPATLPVAPLNDQGVEWLPQQCLVTTMPTIAPAFFFFLRPEGNEMMPACFLCLYLASQCQDCLSPAFLYFPPCCIIRDVTLRQLVFYCKLHMCSTDISNLWKRHSLHL